MSSMVTSEEPTSVGASFAELNRPPLDDGFEFPAESAELLPLSFILLHFPYLVNCAHRVYRTPALQLTEWLTNGIARATHEAYLSF